MWLVSKAPRRENGGRAAKELYGMPNLPTAGRKIPIGAGRGVVRFKTEKLDMDYKTTLSQKRGGKTT